MIAAYLVAHHTQLLTGRGYYVAVALTLIAIAGVLAWSLIGADVEPALRRPGPPLRPGDVWAIQDAPDDLGVDACALIQDEDLDAWDGDFADWEKEWNTR